MCMLVVNEITIGELWTLIQKIWSKGMFDLKFCTNQCSSIGAKTDMIHSK